MKRSLRINLSIAIILLLGTALVPQSSNSTTDLVTYRVKPSSSIKFYLRDAEGRHFTNFSSLKTSIEATGKELKFAMNGGMFMKDQNPLGLYIEEGKVIRKLNTRENAYGNFYLQPNGVFYINDNHQASITTTKNYPGNDNVKYATQSGPMLVIDGKLHPALKKGSTNLHIRNGVGVLPSGELIFAMSKTRVNFYDFATYFKDQGCINALYLDGAISKTYLPAKNWEQLGGILGPIIAQVR